MDALAQGSAQTSPAALCPGALSPLEGVRALVYGSVLGALGLAVAGTYLVHSLDIHSGEDFRQRVQSGFGPLSGAIQGWMLPVKERAQVRNAAIALLPLAWRCGHITPA